MSSKINAQVTLFAAMIGLGAAALTGPFDLPIGLRVPLLVVGTLSGLLLISLGATFYAKAKRAPFSVGGLAMVNLLAYSRVLSVEVYSTLFMIFFAVILIEFGVFLRHYLRHRKTRKSLS